MYPVMIAGAGKIGSTIALLLLGSGAYEVHVMDKDFTAADIKSVMQLFPALITVSLDIDDESTVVNYLQQNKISALVSSLPYFLNVAAAQIAKIAQVHYVDLTEDTRVTDAVKLIAHDATKAFAPQCGLAPGFISSLAHELIASLDSCFAAKLRVGALPVRTTNSLQYALTWSTDGLINQYGNPCFGIKLGQYVTMQPLDDIELIQVDGCEYEAFNTSGGLGDLPRLYENKIHTLNYKTIRYPGHCLKMRFLMNELKLNENRELLKQILEQAVPATREDVVIIYVSVEGMIKDKLVEKSYFKKIYPAIRHGMACSAIQISTASAACVVLDLILTTNAYRGLVMQEQFSLDDFLTNRFGECYV